MISLFPMLKVLFEQTESLTTPPVWTDWLDIVGFAEDYLNFFVTTKKMEGNNDVLIFMVGLIVITFLLKNILKYLSMFFITFFKYYSLCPGAWAPSRGIPRGMFPRGR